MKKEVLENTSPFSIAEMAVEASSNIIDEVIHEQMVAMVSEVLFNSIVDSKVNLMLDYPIENIYYDTESKEVVIEYEEGERRVKPLSLKVKDIANEILTPRRRIRAKNPGCQSCAYYVNKDGKTPKEDNEHGGYCIFTNCKFLKEFKEIDSKNHNFIDDALTAFRYKESNAGLTEVELELVESLSEVSHDKLFVEEMLEEDTLPKMPPEEIIYKCSSCCFADNCDQDMDACPLVALNKSDKDIFELARTKRTTIGR